MDARRADSRFLIELAGASQSVRLSTNMISLQVEYAPLLTLVYADTAMRTAVAEMFTDAVRAIRVADADVARRRVVQAVDLVSVRVAELRAGGWTV